jgi:hypothetical protein
MDNRSPASRLTTCSDHGTLVIARNSLRGTRLFRGQFRTAGFRSNDYQLIVWLIQLNRSDMSAFFGRYR